ncbi:MAG TPA: SRPBCC family protein [Actinocrinis sp.]|nr:SRPBCC family protein [Actinocrinis sp.]
MATRTHDSAKVTLPTDTSIRVTREFDAPRHLVFRAWTTPDLVGRWWHAERGEIASIDIDLRVGGAWRYVMTATGGFEVAFHGEYLEIVPDERLVSTEVYEGVPDAQATTTVVFTEQAGRTTVVLVVEHRTREHRDAHVESGMEDGLQTALNLLEQVAASLG